jgi:glycosyltransferase involved in cell wall biosynthesis
MRTLYLTRNGLLEPLGQRQVLAYLRGLSADYEITLITCEKAADWFDADRMKNVRVVCERIGILWLPQRYRRRPRLLAALVSLAHMFWVSWRSVRRGGMHLIHARSYLPAAVAWAVSRLAGTPFIFDMRALWPEEMITAGRLRRGSLVHHVITTIERVCLRDAAAVVSLTQAAVVHLRHVYPEELNNQRVIVIPTCADLDRFAPVASEYSGHRVHGCIGSVLSGWFRLDWLAEWIDLAANLDSDVIFDIVTRDDADQVRTALDPKLRLGERLRISARLPEDMPEAVREHDLSVMFFTEGLSKVGSCPTRMAEILGCGRPIVTNAGVGDVAHIINKYRVGVLVEGPEPQQMSKALSELEGLLADSELGARCRMAAEEVFSLEAGTEAYRRLYWEVLSTTSGDRVY